MILFLVFLLLLINPIEYLFGLSFTGIDFLIPIFFFSRKLHLRFFGNLFVVFLFLVFSLVLSFLFSDYSIPLLSLIVAILYYAYPYFLFSFSSKTFLSMHDLKRTAYLFVLNFLIIRILMFTELDQKAFPMHDYAFSAALLTFSFLYFYYFEINRRIQVLSLVIIFTLLLSVLMLKTIFAIILFLAWDILRTKGLFYSFLLVSLIILILYFSPVFDKIDAYYTMYYLNDNATEIPRNLMNLQALAFAWDYFPLGIGPGIFWGFPITLFGSELYYDLGYHLVEGLNPDKFHEVNYVFDVFWAGILGEGGITSILFFLAILYYPAQRFKSGTKASSFFKGIFFLFIFQSLVLSIIAQPLFLVLIIVYPAAFYSWSNQSKEKYRFK